MGYQDKTELTVEAIFTKRGREVMADCLAGNLEEKKDYIITKFAVSDDEIDYALWDESQSANLKGRNIENMPILEAFVKGKEMMNYVGTNAPAFPIGSFISNIPNILQLEGTGDGIDLHPITENFDGTEEYEFFLEHDNLIMMYDPWTSPESSFFMEQVLDPANLPPEAAFVMADDSPIPPPIAAFSIEIVQAGSTI